MLTFAVGDVHGCLDKLERLMAACAAYAGAQPHGYVFLGDYVDRGPDSRSVLMRLRRLREEAAKNGQTFVLLKGNHEDVMSRSRFDPVQCRHWLSQGGKETLDSFEADDIADIPVEWFAMIDALPVCYDDGLRFFCHAGINPNMPLERQDNHDLIWIRHDADIDCGRFVVHGHTPQKQGLPKFRTHTLNLDTAACYDGPLTAAAFDNARREPLAFITDAGHVTEPAR